MTFILSTPHLRFLHFFCAPGAGKLFCKAHRACGSHVLRHPFVVRSAKSDDVFRVARASPLGSCQPFVPVLHRSLAVGKLTPPSASLPHHNEASLSRWSSRLSLLANGLQFCAFQRLPAPLLPCPQLVDVPLHSAV